SKSLAALAVAVVAMVAAVGCGSSSSNSSSSSSNAGGPYGGGASTKSTAAPAGGAAAVVDTGVTNNPKIGKKAVLVDSKGFTLYDFEKDKQGGTTSTCNGACASVWPPLTTTGKPTAKGAAVASKPPGTPM